MDIKTLNDLKRQVDKLVSEGKGHWPVYHKAHKGQIYVPIEIYDVTPGPFGAPYEGQQLEPYFWKAPKGEHIIVDLKTV